MYTASIIKFDASNCQVNIDFLDERGIPQNFNDYLYYVLVTLDKGDISVFYKINKAENCFHEFGKFAPAKLDDEKITITSISFNGFYLKLETVKNLTIH